MTVRDTLDAYGVGVRAGVITPQPEDEKALREKLALPEASPAVVAAWEKDGGVRRPITITPVSGEAAPAPAAPAEDAAPL